MTLFQLVFSTAGVSLRDYSGHDYKSKVRKGAQILIEATGLEVGTTLSQEREHPLPAPCFDVFKMQQRNSVVRANLLARKG